MLQTLKKLWPELRPYRGKIILAVLLGALGGGLKSVLPELINRLTTAWADKNEQLTWLIPLGFALIWLIYSVTRFYNLFLMKYSAEQIAVNMRQRLMDKYLSLNMSFFQELERGTGGLISRMVNDIVTIQVGVHRLADASREPVTVIAVLGYLLYLDWRLTLMVLVALPIVTSILRGLAKSLRKYSRRNQEIMEDLTRTLKESLDGTRVVQSFGLEGVMRDKFQHHADNFLSTRRKIIGREEAAGPLSESVTAIFISLLLVYIGTQALKGNFTTGNFISFMVAMAMLQDGIRKLQDAFIKFQQADVAMVRLHEILDSEPTVKEPANPKPFPLNWDKIEFRNVSFAYNHDYVLKNINLTVKRSEKIALVGSSGSGKSTLVNLLQRFFDPSSGEILIGGVSIREMTLRDLRNHIGLVSQDVFLFNDSIERNIEFGRISSSHEVVEDAAKLANAHDFISKAPKGYDTNVGDFGSRISGGEKQRISIARAILKDSPILVLDEATSALDSENEREVQKGLEKLMTGRTAFVIAHRLSTIAKADRILVMKNGEIVEEGSHSDLVDKRGEYFKFYQMQTESVAT